MKLYLKADGEVVGTQAAAGKGYTQIEVPTDKPRLIAYLNGLEAFGKRVESMDEILLEGPRPVSQYESPMDARTTIAGIDAGMCASAIAQMDGRNLSKVIGAGIERLKVLSEQPSAEDLLG